MHPEDLNFFPAFLLFRNIVFTNFEARKLVNMMFLNSKKAFLAFLAFRNIMRTGTILAIVLKSRKSLFLSFRNITFIRFLAEKLVNAVFLKSRKASAQRGVELLH